MENRLSISRDVPLQTCYMAFFFRRHYLQSYSFHVHLSIPSLTNMILVFILRCSQSIPSSYLVKHHNEALRHRFQGSICLRYRYRVSAASLMLLSSSYQVCNVMLSLVRHGFQSSVVALFTAATACRAPSRRSSSTALPRL